MDSVIEFSHRLLRENITDQDITIDMTLGNGYDALELVKISKFVYCFDIQMEACRRAEELMESYNNYTIINDSHIEFDKYVFEEFAGVIFNLGYLPRGNKLIHTEAIVVLETLKKVLIKIKKDGIIVIVFYPGHPSGLQEVEVVGQYLQGLNQKIYDVLKYEYINQENNPPFLIAVKKRI